MLIKYGNSDHNILIYLQKYDFQKTPHLTHYSLGFLMFSGSIEKQHRALTG